MKKFPSIEQFRNVIKQVRLRHDFQGKEGDEPVYSHLTPYPTLKFIGTVKLHGTNAAIVKYKDRIEFQSRERVLSLDQDNSGFMAAMQDKDLSFLDEFEFNDFVAVYGEWCGGNIQKGVAINGLEKMFVVFGVMLDDEWVDIKSGPFYKVSDFGTYEIDIDFEKPELSQNKLIEMTIGVEECCPVGKFFGKDGVGEGIVFTCATEPELKFKSKGEKHSSSKVKVLSPVNAELIESIGEFVEMAVTENRLEQGLSYFKENNIEPDAKNTGEFLRWIVTDVLKEEEITLDEKKVKAAIVQKARVWYLNHI